MGFKYLVLGSGMQGTAGGYDLAKFGDADSLIMADLHLDVAEKAAARINQLLKSKIVKAEKVDAADKSQLLKLFSKVDAVFSATSYAMNLKITEAAIEAGVHLIDLGGNTDVVKSQLKLHEKALQKKISIIPDCGLAPGLGNTLAAFGIEQLDQTEEVQIRCGGLPQNPKPPLNYKLVFSIAGLTNEYFGKAYILKNGKVMEIDTFSDYEHLRFPAPVGEVEAFVTTGGTSTCPWTYEGKVKNYDYKTVRYLGHHEKIKCMIDLGLLDLEPVDVKGVKVVPRDLFHTCVAPRIDFPEDKDLVVLRTTVKGLKDGKPKILSYEVMDFHDDLTGFTAMERTTAFPAALVLILSAHGLNKKGVVPLERALDNKAFMEAFPKRGIPLKSGAL